MGAAHDNLPASLSGLLKPAAYPHAAGEIRLIETHMSWLVLAGEFVYKIKRPVRYPFVDMRTAERRRFLCEEELRLNRRFAPDLYLEVVPITSGDDGVRVGGSGEIVEHAVRMRRFSPDEELARLLARKEATPTELAEFGRSLARIHAKCPAVDASSPYGSSASVRASLTENIRQFESLSIRAGVESGAETLGAAIQSLLDTRTATIETRRASGHVKECHGDLHCRNVVRYASRLVAFDCLEFEPAFRWIDMAEEIAFLFMDLTRRGGDAQAFAFLNAYFSQGGDFGAAHLVRLYAAHRALVRAKVASIESSAAGDEPHRIQALEERGDYLACAQRMLRRASPALILMSGFSGSGKTWLAERLASAMGAIHLRSDVERKRLAGLGEHASSGSSVGEGLYAADIDLRTYQRLAECAADVLSGGFTAIVDATFQRRADRERFVSLAADCEAPIALVRCRAPEAVLRARILGRAESGNDASEAGLAVLERQLARYEAIDPGENIPHIDADTTSVDVVAETKARLAPFLV